MSSLAAKQCFLHGAIILFYGVALGAPYGMAIARGAASQVVNSWRVAHQSLSLAGALLLALAACLASFEMGVTLSWSIAGLFVLSSYIFCLALTVAPLAGTRGLSRGEHGWKAVAYYGNVSAAWLSLAGCLLLVIAAVVVNVN